MEKSTSWLFYNLFFMIQRNRGPIHLATISGNLKIVKSLSEQFHADLNVRAKVLLINLISIFLVRRLTSIKLATKIELRDLF